MIIGLRRRRDRTRLTGCSAPFFCARSFSLNRYNWNEPPVSGQATAEELAESLRIPLAGARFLVARGLTEPDRIVEYLRPSPEHAGDPFAFEHMVEAVACIKNAADGDRPVLIHGDYDVDGISGTAILYRYLSGVFTQVYRFVPDRRRDGYGLAERAVDWALENGVGLVITVDCGTSDGGLIERLRSGGADVIVCDHHEFPPDGKVAGLMLNPVRPGETYPFAKLCGAGVAYKLIEALHDSGIRGGVDPVDLADLLALGTVGDVMPLVGENRYYVRTGLELMNSSPRAGLSAIREHSRIGSSAIRAGHIAFVFAPRINAPGRVGRPKTALEILCTDNEAEARQLAVTLEENNNDRRHLTDIVRDDAFSRIRDMDDRSSRGCYVLAGDHWDEGVLGIAAARVAEEFGRPAILLSTAGDLAKGSGRSVRGVDLKKHVDRLQDFFIRYGGHSQAVGLTMRRDRIESFGEKLSDSLKEDLDTGAALPGLEIDSAINLEECDLDLLRFFEKCEPFGHGNREPVWKISDVEVLDTTTFVGNNHLKLFFRDARGNSGNAIAFGWDRPETPEDLHRRAVDIAVRIKRSFYMGREDLDLHVVDIRSHKG